MTKELQINGKYKFILITDEYTPCNEYMIWNMWLCTILKIKSSIVGFVTREQPIYDEELKLKCMKEASEKVYNFYMKYKPYKFKYISKDEHDNILKEFDELKNG